MRRNIKYDGPDRKVNDDKALKDIKQYLGPKLYAVLLEESEKVEEYGTADAFQQLNYAMSFGGIEGYPVHAWGRRHTPKAYRKWMAEGGFQLDNDGFVLKNATEG